MVDQGGDVSGILHASRTLYDANTIESGRRVSWAAVGRLEHVSSRLKLLVSEWLEIGSQPESQYNGKSRIAPMSKPIHKL